MRNKPRSVVDGAFRVLRALPEAGREHQVARLADLTGLPRPTVHRLLGQLRDSGAVTWTAGRWTLSASLQRWAVERRHGRVGGGTGRASCGPGGGAAQGCLFAVDLFGEFGVGLLGPVVAELVVVVITEIVGGGVGEECLWEVEAHAEAAGVHRHLQQCAGGGLAGLFVAAQEFGGSGQILRDPTGVLAAGEGVGQQTITLRGQGHRGGQRRGVERVGNAHRVAGQQFPRPAVRISHVRFRQGGVVVGVLGPQRAQHQDRAALLVDQQLVHGGRDPLTDLRIAEVVLGLVQPHHRPRPHPVQVLQGGLGSGRVEGMPQPPPLLGERLHGLPASPGLARRRRPHQDHDPAAAPCGRSRRLVEHYVVRAPYIPGKHPRTVDARRGLIRGGGMDFQLVWPHCPIGRPGPDTSADAVPVPSTAVRLNSSNSPNGSFNTPASAVTVSTDGTPPLGESAFDTVPRPRPAFLASSV
ncbi:helix-turn-helix domain-containing protein [Streptomyces sp. NPDC004528]|uniref:helix-turn-helix domain-containing protein n=1 Tax=Streptomyces sp. NPDC004528 TaxID=3154550 RepID=UPI0033BC1A49